MISPDQQSLAYACRVVLDAVRTGCGSVFQETLLTPIGFLTLAGELKTDRPLASSAH